MNRKYLFGIVGLILGLLVSFTLTRSYNNNNAKPISAATGGMAQPTGTGGSGANQQAMMADVAKIIDNAKSNPKDYDAQIKAATAYYQIGKFDETAEYLEKAYAANPQKLASEGALGFLGQHYFEKKNYPEAEKWMRLAIASETKDTDKAEMQVVLAKTFMQREPAQPDKAIQELQNALKLAPKDVHAVGHLVEAYALKRDAKSAEEALNQLKGLEPKSQRIPVLENLIAEVKAGRPVTLPKEGEPAGH